jgi:hypothetical protein
MRDDMNAKLSKLILLTGLIVSVNSMGAELAPMATDINSTVKNSVSEKMQKGLISDSVSSVPIFDNVVKHGIKMPEDANTATKSEVDETQQAKEERNPQK